MQYIEKMNYTCQLSLPHIPEKYKNADGNALVMFNNDGSLQEVNLSQKELIVSFIKSTNISIFIPSNTYFSKCVIKAQHSNNSVIYIGHSQRKICNLGIYSKYSTGNFAYIGENLSCGGCMILFSENANITIGADCMFSDNIKIWNSDGGHTILDKEGKCINHSRDISIGNHVWIGMDSTISKGAVIKDGSIVGQKTLVTGKFKESNVILAGVPAQIIKKNIYWKRNPPIDFD